MVCGLRRMRITGAMSINAPRRTTELGIVADSDFQAAVVTSMRMLAADPRTVFVGQSVRYDGAAIYHSLDGVPMDKRLEFPVVENLQLGYCTGLSLTGKIPICIYPRMDFMLLAMDQLVQHLDKLPLYGWKPRVIIRCRVGQKKPLDAGPQHTQNFCWEFGTMLKNVRVMQVRTAYGVTDAYQRALDFVGSTLVVENPYG